MSKVGPPAGFAGVRLALHRVPSGKRFGRILLDRYPDALGVGKTPSRFSDPRRRKAENRFGVLYLGETVKVCFLEAVLRDQRDGAIGDWPIAEAELRARSYADIEVASPLRLVDLRNDGAVIMGVPSDVAKAQSQTLARKWSVALHEHPEKPDGIIYPSRLNGHANLAIFDRSINRLRLVTRTPLLAAPGLAAVLDDLKIGIVGEEIR